MATHCGAGTGAVAALWRGEQDTQGSNRFLHNVPLAAGNPWLRDIPNKGFALRLSGLTAAEAYVIQEFV